MIIRNYRQLAQSRLKRDALKILESGLYAASPEIGLRRCLEQNRIHMKDESVDLSKYSGIHVVAFGKSAGLMTKTVDSILDVKSGIVIVPRGSDPTVKGAKFRVFRASHPTPDRTSIEAARQIVKFLKRRKSSEIVVFLVSGGGSSLLCMPDGLELSDKSYVCDLLLKSGATIQEFNCIRKHLSRIKGGRLVENLPCMAVSLIMSDVIDDDMSSIASGTTYYDSTTFSDAQNIIKKYRLTKKLPAGVLSRIADGAAGKIPETPKRQMIPNMIIARNSDCLDAMKEKAGELGYLVSTSVVSGDIKDAARSVIDCVTRKKRSCHIFGGETTVRVTDGGIGGRNQEMVLRILKGLKNTKETIISSIGTDGIDGNTKFAGALSEIPEVDSRVIDSYLKESNSNVFFEQYGGLVQTGHTRTNLMDIGLVLQ